MRIIIVLAMLMGVTGSPDVTSGPPADSAHTAAHPNSIPETADKTGQVRSKLVHGCLFDWLPAVVCGLLAAFQEANEMFLRCYCKINTQTHKNHTNTF